MYNLATEEFGKVGTNFYTNVAYKYHFPHERDYNPFYVEPVEEAIIEEAEAEDKEDEDDEDIADDEEDIGIVVANEPASPPDLPDPADLPDATQVALINKLRKGAYEARLKQQESARLGQRKMWGKTWVRMSAQSQAKVSAITEQSTAMDRHLKKSPQTHIW
jgi:hypothetical protein